MANSGKILAALVLGAVAGAAIGVLFAPDKGSETRKKVVGKVNDLGDDLKSRFTKGKEAINDIKDRTVNRSEEIKNSARSN